MDSDKIDTAVTPRQVWVPLQGRAKSEYQDKATSTLLTDKEQLSYECTVLAALEFDDVGTEDEWLAVQDEALQITEAALK